MRYALSITTLRSFQNHPKVRSPTHLWGMAPQPLHDLVGLFIDRIENTYEASEGGV